MKNTATHFYIPAFDGMRGVSILIVLIAHLGFDKIVPGGLGVTIFFFISGFLITKLLIDEFTKNGRIDLKQFFIRRMLRLYPPLLFFILVLTAVIFVMESKIYVKELSAAFFYYENYFALFTAEADRRYNILWSLAVEEHFYLVFPFLVVAFIGRKNLFLGVTILLTLATLLVRVYIAWKYNANEFSVQYTYSLSHCRIDSILYGCLLSIIFYVDGKKKFLKFTSSPVVFVTSVALLLFTLLFRDEFFRQTFRYSLQGLALLMLIPAVLYQARYSFLNRLLSNSVLIFIGKLSYGIYLFHYVAIYISDHMFAVGSINWYILNVALSFALSLSTFYWIEKPVMQWRKRFGSNVPAPEKFQSFINVPSPVLVANAL